MNGILKVVSIVTVAALMASCEKRDNELPATPLQVSPACDVEAGCVAGSADFSLHLSMGPGMRVLVPFPLSVEVQGDQSVDAVTAHFAMQGMDMGMNRYQLISDGADRWFANVTLPVCASGRSDWLVVIEVMTKGRRFTLEVPFAVGK